jgi:arginine utilization protein RocB
MTHHYLVVVKVKERLSVSKRPAQKFDMERFNLRKLNDMKVKEQYQVKIPNRFAAVENSMMMTTTTTSMQGIISENTKTSATKSLDY